jgi:hypothetical protein
MGKTVPSLNTDLALLAKTEVVVWPLETRNEGFLTLVPKISVFGTRKGDWELNA